MLTPEEMEARGRLKEQGGTPELGKQFTHGVAKLAGHDEATRTIPFTISTPTPDRHDDIVYPMGGDFKNYEANPLVLYAHNKRALPIGKGSNLVKTDEAVTMDKTFATRDEYDFADTVYQLLLGGFLNACSIGFLPIKWAWNEARSYWARDFLEWELLESSVCTVPANPEALQEAKQLGIDLEPMVKWASEVLDVMGNDSPIARARMEAAYKHAAEHPSFHFIKGLVDHVKQTCVPVEPSQDEMIKRLESAGYQIIKSTGDDPITQTDEAPPARILEFEG